MKNIRDWISCQLISKSLLSARPLNFSGEDPPRESNQGTSTVTDHASPSSSQSVSTIHGNNASHSLELTIEGDVSSTSESNAGVGNIRDPVAKIEGLLVDYLRVMLRFDVPLDNPRVAHVVSRLKFASLIEASESDMQRGAGLKFERARTLAAEREASSEGDLEVSLRILVLGKTGVGKSSTINSIFRQECASTNAFCPSTEHIQEFTGIVKGMKLTIIDTPGLFPSYTNQRRNRKILHAVRSFIRKFPPDLVLYVERGDSIPMGYSDFPLLKLIGDILGPSIWFNTVLTMTHCSSVLEGSDGYPIGYGSFARHCTNLIQHYIQQIVPGPKLDIPVLLVDNHIKCRTNTQGDRILPNGEAWRNTFFLLSASSKILADANKLVSLRGGLVRRPTKTRSPSLPHLLSMLLRPRSSQAPDGNDNELDETMSLCDNGGDEYDKLPPIRILTKDQFERLTKAQKNDYLDELEYRETLYLKKQWKEELRRRREIPEAAERPSESYDKEEMGDPYDAAPLPDIAVPETFDSEDPVYRYRCPIYGNRFMVRPVLVSDGWDHDVNLDGINLESSVDLRRSFNASVIGQLSKDKEELNLHAESLVKYRDPRGRALSAGVDVQTSGKDVMYTLTGGAKLRSSNCNTTGLGLSLTSFCDVHLPGLKIENMLTWGNRMLLHLNAGSIFGCGKAAHGGGIGATVRGRDYPVRDEGGFTVGATLISFDKEMVLGASVQSAFRAGRGNKISANLNLNSRNMGQISIKTSASERTEIALAATLISILWKFFSADKSHGAIGE